MSIRLRIGPFLAEQVFAPRQFEFDPIVAVVRIAQTEPSGVPPTGEEVGRLGWIEFSRLLAHR